MRDTFWRYGYAGTSMDQLSAATGLHKPSLYGAFGDKKKLYLAALDNYLADVRAEFAEAFAVPDLFESLAAMTEWSIDKFMGKDEAGTGCFMMHTAMPEAAEDPEISRVGARIDGFARPRPRPPLREGDRGRPDLGRAPIRRRWRWSWSPTITRFPARARAGYSRAELRALADRALGLVRAIGRRAPA